MAIKGDNVDSVKTVDVEAGTVEDACGNITTCEHTFTVEDQTAPYVFLASSYVTSTHAAEYAFEIIALLFKDLHFATNIKFNIASFHEGVLALLQNTVSPLLLPFETIQTALSGIKTYLKDHDRFELAHLNQHQVYNTVPFSWTFYEGSIYITMQFPLVIQNNVLQVFHIMTMPMPINRTSSYTTQLTNVPALIAISKDSRHYALPTGQNWHPKRINHSPTPLISTKNPNCGTALIAQDKKVIKSHCKFAFETEALKPSIIPLGKNEYVVSAITKISLKCNGKSSQISGCPFCIMTFPCGCDIQAEPFYLPPHLSHCKQSSTDITIDHPVNLALLQHFYTDIELSDIQGDTTYSSPTQYKLPDIKLFQHNYTQHLAIDKNIKLDLTKMVTAIKNDKQIFHSLAEPLLESLDSITDDGSEGFTFTYQITLFATIAFVILDTIICVYLFIKYRATAMMLAALPKVNSQYVPTIYHLFATTPTPTTSVPNITQVYQNTSPVIYIILAFCCAYGIYKLVQWLKHTKPHATVMLEITNGQLCLLLPIVNVPCCPKFLHFQSSQDLGDMTVTSHLLHSKLQVDWQDLVITNLLTNKTIPLPESIAVTPWSAIKLKQTISKQYHAFLVCTHDNYSFYTHTCELDCKKCTLPLTVVVE